MQLNYIVKDNEGNAGQNIMLTRGETKTVSVFLFNKDGSPFVFPATVTELLVKVFSNISQMSIQKTFTGALVTLFECAALGGAGLFGFQFTLLPADTNQMAANAAPLPMTATITDSSGNVTELDFLAVFEVEVPAVLT